MATLIKRADGKIRWMTATKVPMRNHYNEITGIVGVSRDITEQKWPRKHWKKQQKN